MDHTFSDIGSLFLASADAYGSRPACQTEAGQLSYAALRDHALRLSGLLAGLKPVTAAASPLWLACSRSLSGYVGVLAALCDGRGYIPLDPAWPAARVAGLFDRTGADVIVCDRRGLEGLVPVLADRTCPGTIILPLESADSPLPPIPAHHRVLTAADVEAAAPDRTSRATPESTAFILFTSGSTGTPKGVRIPHRAALATNAALRQRYSFSSGDRFAQMADFTWDPSVVDMLLAWASGGVVMVPTQRQAFLPDSFLKQSQATVAHVVPATLRQLDATGRLKPGSLPDLRLVLVGGEPFPAGLARRFQTAAPGARIVNVYGAQEYSIISTCDVTPGLLESLADEASVPMGRVLGPGELHLLDAERSPDGSMTGELCLHGPQVFAGYLDDHAATTSAFLFPEGNPNAYYRTGDFVRRTASGDLIGLGRRDSQVKIAGMRIELGEIEKVIHELTGADAVLVLPWPGPAGEVRRLVAFIAGGEHAESGVAASLKLRLPSFMIPHRIFVLPEFPRTPNGKWDRQALLARCLRDETVSRTLHESGPRP